MFNKAIFGTALMHLYPDGSSGKGEAGGQKAFYCWANLFIGKTESQWGLLEGLPEYRLSPMTRLTDGVLGIGKYGCSELLFSC